MWASVISIGARGWGLRTGARSDPAPVPCPLPSALEVQVHPDGFHLRIVLERVRAHFAAEAARLVAAEGGRGVVHVVGVDPDGARLELPRYVVRLLDVARPDG